MSAATRNSMAAIMNVVTGIVMWLALIVGVIGTILLAVGLIYLLSDGAVSIPGFEQFAVDVTVGELVIALLTWVVLIIGIYYICIQLRRILATLAAGDPFVPDNASRLGRVAFVIALMEILRYATQLFVWAFPDLMSGATPRLSVNLILWASVAALAVLSQVFREGTRLRDEEKMTI